MIISRKIVPIVIAAVIIPVAWIATKQLPQSPVKAPKSETTGRIISGKIGTGNASYAFTAPKKWTLRWTYSCLDARPKDTFIGFVDGAGKNVIITMNHDVRTLSGKSTFLIDPGNVAVTIGSACTWAIDAERIPQ